MLSNLSRRLRQFFCFHVYRIEWEMNAVNCNYYRVRCEKCGRPHSIVEEFDNDN